MRPHLPLSLVLSMSSSVLLLASACSKSKNDAVSPDDPTVDLMPLAKGATWTYQAKIVRFDEDAGKEVTTTIPWTTEVVEVLEGTVTGYVIRGWPRDLTDFETTPQPEERVLLRAGDAYLWGRSRDADSVEGAEGWFTEPLMDGQRVCPDPGISYCWDIRQTSGAWDLTFRTGPDEESYRIKRGTGVVRYHYAHHGTTNEVVADLVKFTPGKDTP